MKILKLVFFIIFIRKNFLDNIEEHSDAFMVIVFRSF